MNDTIKYAKMQAFFEDHLLDNIKISLGIDTNTVYKAANFISKIGKISKIDAIYLLNEDRKEANKLVDILQDLKKYKTKVENSEDTDKDGNPKNERDFDLQHDYSDIEIHPLERDVSSTLPHSTFNVPEGQLLNPIGPAG